jgi:ribosomal protein S15P/S13E
MPKKKVEKTEEKKEKAEKPKKISQKEYEKKVIELAGKGLTAEKIGEELRKQGIHSKEYDKKISKILGDKYVNPDLKNVEAKLQRIEKHCETNKQDKRAKREKSRVFSQLRKVKKYLKQL